MRVWVTGGAGFIGSHLVDRLLRDGHRVDALDDLSMGRFANLADARALAGFGFHQLDVLGPDISLLAERHRPDVMVHLAGRTFRPGGVPDPVSEARLTVGGALNTLEAARAVGARLVGVVHATPETDVAPSTPAEISAWTVVDHLRVHGQIYDLETVCVPIANVYGPRQRVDGDGPLVAKMVAAALAGEPLVVHAGDHSRDLLFVDDAVDALARCVEGSCTGVIPVGSGRSTTPSSVAQIVIEAAGTDGQGQIVDGPARQPDADRPAWPMDLAAELLGWAPWTSLEHGVRQTVEWFRRTQAADAG